MTCSPNVFVKTTASLKTCGMLVRQPRRAVIRADHRVPTARGELEKSWKERLERKGCASSVAASAAAKILDGQVQYDETDD